MEYVMWNADVIWNTVSAGGSYSKSYRRLTLEKFHPQGLV